jgi:hypothetical protein
MRLASAAPLWWLLAGAAVAQPALTQSVITPAAQAIQPQLCTGQGYPTPWVWSAPAPFPEAAEATTGTPHIEQWRAGKPIAVYSAFGSNGPDCTYKNDGTDWQTPGPAAESGCGAFARNHAWRLWAPGDVYKVFPAVYAGDNQQPYIASMYDGPAQYNAGTITPMQNVTIRGAGNLLRPVVQLATLASSNSLNQAPVYIGASSGVVWRGIDVVGLPGVSVGKAGFYTDSANNLTVEATRVTGFAGAGNGFFATGNNTGTLTLRRLELDHNGGSNGPEHNAYINASLVDPNYKVIFERSWSHDALYGHLFKSRAQQTVIDGSYLMGGLPLPGQTQAEAFNLDVPNGGRLTVTNTIFTKGASGPFSNGIGIAYGEEGCAAGGPLCPFVQAVSITNNTFLATSLDYDGSHGLFPLWFFPDPAQPLAQTPSTPGWPVNVPVNVADNAFAGYCPAGTAVKDYRGLSETLSPAEINLDYSAAAPYTDAIQPPAGQVAYSHVVGSKVTRATPVLVGARP